MFDSDQILALSLSLYLTHTHAHLAKNASIPRFPTLFMEQPNVPPPGDHQPPSFFFQFSDHNLSPFDQAGEISLVREGLHAQTVLLFPPLSFDPFSKKKKKKS
ncbi:hypothetical protein IE53DRAFT_23163 [Violaceomyces palustris]|uniref:Uncharacterized protein n=1 Tax=Violaceomyces palustris TaxID=1673888 RepID=A0ACD0P1R3_9BASI|nr:hypothetical protein IE53DRAFT_23163 [Violaceomyces palustris]